MENQATQRVYMESVNVPGIGLRNVLVRKLVKEVPPRAVSICIIKITRPCNGLDLKAENSQGSFREINRAYATGRIFPLSEYEAKRFQQELENFRRLQPKRLDDKALCVYLNEKLYESGFSAVRGSSAAHILDHLRDKNTASPLFEIFPYFSRD